RGERALALGGLVGGDDPGSGAHRCPATAAALQLTVGLGPVDEFVCGHGPELVRAPLPGVVVHRSVGTQPGPQRLRVSLFVQVRVSQVDIGERHWCRSEIIRGTGQCWVCAHVFHHGVLQTVLSPVILPTRLCGRMSVHEDSTYSRYSCWPVSLRPPRISTPG